MILGVPTPGRVTGVFGLLFLTFGCTGGSSIITEAEGFQTYSIKGLCVDSDSGKGLEGVSVTLEEEGPLTTHLSKTEADGTFSVDCTIYWSSYSEGTSTTKLLGGSIVFARDAYQTLKVRLPSQSEGAFDSLNEIDLGKVSLNRIE